MDQLPDLVLCKIFAQLELRDRVRCRQISKRFLFVLDHLAPRELVFKAGGISRLRNWFDDHRVADRCNLIRVNLGSRIFESDRLGGRHFLHLRKLQIVLFDLIFSPYARHPIQMNLSFLNGFSKTLRTLYIGLPIALVQLDCRQRIVLKELRYLSLDLRFTNFDTIFSGPDACLQLEAENLEYFQLEDSRDCPNFRRFNLMHTENVRHVRISFVDDIEPKAEFLKRFENVQQFDCLLRRENSPNLVDMIRLLDRFKDLRILLMEAFANFHNRELIRQLSDHSKAAWPKLQIFVNGLLTRHLDELNRFEQDGHLDAEKLSFYLKHHQSTSKLLRFFVSLDYNPCETFGLEMCRKTLDCFVDKLVNLISVRVNGPVNYPKCLLDFLRRFVSITELELTCSSLGQQFYQQLGDHLPYLATLVIHDDPALLNSIDFRFLFQFDYLEEFKVNTPRFDLQLACDLFMENPHLYRIYFPLDCGRGGRFGFLAKVLARGELEFLCQIDDEQLRCMAKQLAEQYNRKNDTSMFRFKDGTGPPQFVFAIGDR